MNQFQEVIDQLLEKKNPYEWDISKRGDDGVSEDLYWPYWNGEEIESYDLIAKAGDPPTTMCLGAWFEVLIKGAIKLERYKDTDLNKVVELKEYSWIKDKENYQGIGQALIDIGWGEKITEWEDIVFPTFAQIWHEKDNRRAYGHSVLITDKYQEGGKKWVRVFHSSPSQKTYGMKDFAWEHKYKSGLERKWYMARWKNG